jgi:4-hydroxybenzoate polyprenyltransferase
MFSILFGFLILRFELLLLINIIWSLLGLNVSKFSSIFALLFNLLIFLCLKLFGFILNLFKSIDKDD